MSEIYASYFDNGQSVYSGAVEALPAVVPVATLPTPDAVDDRLLEQARNDPVLFARLIEDLYGTRETWFRSTEELLASDETRSVESNQTARWNVKE